MSTPAGEAFNAFVGQVSNEKTRKFLESHKEAVLALHVQGGRGNLRTLKHAMWDFEKIGSQLTPRHWSKEESVLKIMKGAMAVTMEYRAGKLTEDDLVSLIGTGFGRSIQKEFAKQKSMADEIEKQKSKADEIDERYPQVDFDNILLEAHMLGAILLRGEIDAQALVAKLDETNDYAESTKQPLWLQAVQAARYGDDTVCERIAQEVETAFANREFIVRGEFFQIVGIRLWFAEIGLLATPPEDIISESKAYIDDLARDERLETSLDRPLHDFRDGVYGGYQIAKWEAPEHRKIVAHYDNMAQTQDERQYPRLAKELLDKLSVDPDGFLFDLAPNGVRNGRYWDRPLLASLPARDYAKVVFNALPAIQSRGIEALHSRHHQADSSLKSELPWIAEVKAELEKLMEIAKPMSRYRLRSLIANNLDPLLSRQRC